MGEQICQSRKMRPSTATTMCSGRSWDSSTQLSVSFFSSAVPSSALQRKKTSTSICSKSKNSKTGKLASPARSPPNWLEEPSHSTLTNLLNQMQMLWLDLVHLDMQEVRS